MASSASPAEHFSSPATQYAPPPAFTDKPAPAYANAPALPQEPAQRSQSWIKWVVLVLIIAAIGGGVLLAKNMGAFPGMGGAPSPSAPAVDKNAISPEDKAKAEALVGPQGGSRANDPSVVTINPPAGSADPAAPAAQPAPLAPPPPPPVQAPVLPEPPPASVQVTQPGTANTTPDVKIAPNPVQPKPAQRPPAQPRRGGPSLDDLLD
ncbi:zinc ribbon domain-containing protein [Comamonas fluminis]|uniref:zinc ribbon domain-containing protein n=1 Tax=Comamonas fluminis TaxID=2796366 RepID=UPI001FE335D8|nr:zinc ribbon domain-containing protein [Comamonas fluminis]